MPHVLLIFLDGVGLGADDAAVNPFLNATLPVIHSLLGGRHVTHAATPYHGLRASLVGIDAVLGVAGTPQSGTGQAALLTGSNAAVQHGRHFGPWVPAQLRHHVRAENLLTRAAQRGHSVAFANAYPEEALDVVLAADLPSDAPRRAGARQRAPRFLRAGPPLAALGAGVLTRHTTALEQGDAVASEITNEGWREGLGRKDVPLIDAPTAGRNLARIAAQHDLTLFAHYATDYAGHLRDMAAAVVVLQRVDAFVGGVIDYSADSTLVIITSDHGNIEDIRVGHTRNPAIGIVIGHGHEAVARRLESLVDVTPVILELLRSS